MARNYNYHTAVVFTTVNKVAIIIKVYDNWEVFMWKPLAAWFDLACTNSFNSWTISLNVRIYVKNKIIALHGQKM